MLERRGTKVHQDGLEESAPRERKVPAAPGPQGHSWGTGSCESCWWGAGGGGVREEPDTCVGLRTEAGHREGSLNGSLVLACPAPGARNKVPPGRCA